MSLENNIIDIYQKISNTKKHDQNVKILAVSKQVSVNSITSLYRTGQFDFGENYVQEALPKIKKLINLEKICWHFIGLLQRNKTKDVATYFDWIHTIDRISIAQRLNDQRPANMQPLMVCLQINCSQELANGIDYSEMFAYAKIMVKLPKLQLRGIMCHPTRHENTSEIFAKMYQLYLELKKKFPEQNIDTLSMGTSNDFAKAINAGSNLIRLGTALFGSRTK